ncbi:MAG: hypothetical protein ABIF11_02675 [Nitrospirota bacterium]
MKKMLLFTLMISFGIANQVKAFEKQGMPKQDAFKINSFVINEFGTTPMLSCLSENVTFLDEMNMKVSLTPDQLQKMKMIVKEEKDGLDLVQQKWMELLKNEKPSVEERREGRNNMDNQVIEIAKKTKTEVEETLTPYQYNEFALWVKQKWEERKTNQPKPQELATNPFLEAIQKNNESKGEMEGSSTMTEEQKQARDRFMEAITAQSEKAQKQLSESIQQPDETKNPFSSPSELGDKGLEGLTMDQEAAAERFKEALRKHTEENKE